MKLIWYFVLICLLVNLINSYFIKPGHHNKIISNFSFGSCYEGFLANRYDIFNSVLKENSEIWIWIGDATYLDNIRLNYFKYEGKFDGIYVEKMFNITKNDKYYKELNKIVPVIGIWDDHDYGSNDANKNFPFKEETKKYFLDFLDEPEDSERRKLHRGIYTTYSFGDYSSHKTLRIILLDVRFHKDNYLIDNDADMLGKDQWIWLEKVLKNANETFILIGSGTQILFIDRIVTESWLYYSRIKMFELIGKLNKSGVVLFSGDIHCAEILKTFCIQPDIGYHIYEISSSGLSHYCSWKLLNDFFLSNRYNIVPFLDNYNFGIFEFNWGDNIENSQITMKILDIDNKLYSNITLKYEDLVYDKNKIIEDKLNRPFNYRNCKTRLYSRFKSFNEYIVDFNKLNALFIILLAISVRLIYLCFKMVYGVSMNITSRFFNWPIIRSITDKPKLK